MTHAESQQRNQKIVEMRNAGATLDDIGKEVGLTRHGVAWICDQLGVQRFCARDGALIPLDFGQTSGKLDDETVARKVADCYSNFDYVGGYTGSEGKIDIKCKTCGTIYSRLYNYVLKGKAVCKNCQRNALLQAKAELKSAKAEEKAKWPYKHSEAEIDAIVSERLPGFEYVGGYTGSDGFADIRCLACGLIFKRSFVSIRHGKGRCPACYEKELFAKNGEREARKAEEKAAAAERERIRREEAERRRLEKLAPKYRRVCVECGKQFETNKARKVCCSPECTKHRQNRHKDRRLKQYGQKENGITLRRLYKRDAGVCYLCGRTCDWNDKTTDENGTIICGETYPSIEHVIPLSLGGPNDWDNVRLACRGCNTAKRDASDVKMYADGRLAINL